MEKETIKLVRKMIEDGNLSQEIAEKYCPELKENLDEKIRKWLICTLRSLNNSPVQIDGAYEMMLPAIAWLEKQGEHANFRNKIQIGDKVTRNEDGVLVNLSQLKRVAKPADKVEPKFHEDEWVVTDKNNVVHIKAIENGKYVLENTMSFTVDYVDKCWRKWTILDAKEGDVLSYRDGQWCFIYKGIVTEDTFKYYALLSEKGITVNDAAFSLLASCIIPATKGQRDTLMKAMADAGYTFDFEKKELKKIEQKPADKVEPKFKEGDWVVSEFDKKVRYVSEVHCDNYNNYYVIRGDVEMEYAIEEYDRLHHLWTIQDAKPGDVLATLDYILIFEKLLPKDGGVSYCHYDFGSGNPQFIWFEDKNWYFGKEAIIHPATKEQRDLLFQKMKEAGYMWDEKKLELKIEEKPVEKFYSNGLEEEIEVWVGEKAFPEGTKITPLPEAIKIVRETALHFQKWEAARHIDGRSQKEQLEAKQDLTWSEEDECIMNAIFKFLDGSDALSVDQQQAKYWTKSIKDRVQPQPKQEWSEEDYLQLEAAIDIVANSGHTCTSDWLKSLRPQKPLTNEEIEQAKKEYRNVALSKMDYIPEELTYDDGWDDAISYMKKSLRPKNGWKPSDDQMKALDEAVHGKIPESNALWYLYNDLKKLIEC